MKTSTKWILGVVISLVVLVILVAVAYLAVSRWTGAGWMVGARGVRPWEGWRAMPMHPNWDMPGVRYFGIFPLRLISGGLICFGFLSLIVIGVIALVRVLRAPQRPTQSPPQVGDPESFPAAVQSCPACTRAVQDDWSHCPYCGHTLS